MASDEWDVQPKPETEDSWSLLAELAADPDVDLTQVGPGVYVSGTRGEWLDTGSGPGYVVLPPMP